MIITGNKKFRKQWEEMTDGRFHAYFQQIKETIRTLQSLKEQGSLPAEQTDASITALQNRLSTKAEPFPLGMPE